MTDDPTTTLAAALLSMPVITAKSPEDAARKRAAHQLAVLADEGWAIVRAETVEVQYGVEATLLIDGGREVQGPKTLEQCEQRIERQQGKSWVADGQPLDPVLVTRTVTTTPWTPTD